VCLGETTKCGQYDFADVTSATRVKGPSYPGANPRITLIRRSWTRFSRDAQPMEAGQTNMRIWHRRSQYTTQQLREVWWKNIVYRVDCWKHRSKFKQQNYKLVLPWIFILFTDKHTFPRAHYTYTLWYTQLRHEKENTTRNTVLSHRLYMFLYQQRRRRKYKGFVFSQNYNNCWEL